MFPTFRKLFVTASSAASSIRTFWRLRWHRIILLMIVAASVILPLLFVQSGRVGVDDAFISFRFARNLADGNGPVFNQGEKVEGYSCFLYVLLIAAGLKAGVNPENVYWIALAINILSGVGLVLFVYWVAASFGRGWAVLAAGLTALCPAIAFWSTTGMETVPVILVQVAMVFFVAAESDLRAKDARLSPWLALALAVSILLRADGFLVPLLAVAFFLADGKVKLAGKCLAVILAVGVPYFLWRYHYYGYWFPNTYYAKLDVGTVSERMASAYSCLKQVLVPTGLFMPMTVLATLFLLAVKRSLLAGWGEISWSFRSFLARLDSVRFAVMSNLDFPLVFFAAWVGYYFYIGGDIVPRERMLVVLFPVAVLTVVRKLAENQPFIKSFLNGLGQPAENRGDVGTVFIALVLVSQVVIPIMFGNYHLPIRMPSVHPLVWVGQMLEGAPKAEGSAVKTAKRTNNTWEAVGRFIAEEFPGNCYAVDGAGNLSYWGYPNPVIDMLGLCDENIAHSITFNAFAPGHCKTAHWEYIKERSPNLIVGFVTPNPDDEIKIMMPNYEERQWREDYNLSYLALPYSDIIIPVGEKTSAEVAAVLKSSPTGGRIVGVFCRKDVVLPVDDSKLAAAK